jgi:SAM-dependent methyltransferase
MNVKLLITKANRVIQKHGLYKSFVFATLYWRQRSLVDEFDRTHGTDTSGKIPLWEYSIDSPNAKFGGAYQGTDASVVEKAMTLVARDPKSLAFIDLGCGKGKALILAWKLGFRSVIGVEFAKELVDVARKNFQILGVKNSHIIAADAATYEFPNEDFVLYLFNPFSAEIMKTVVDNLRLVRTNYFVVYCRPDAAAIFDESGLLERIGEIKDFNQRLIVWRSKNKQSA